MHQWEYHIAIVTNYWKEVFNQGIIVYFEKKLAIITEHLSVIKIGAVNQYKDIQHFIETIPTRITDGRKNCSTLSALPTAASAGFFTMFQVSPGIQNPLKPGYAEE
jgi:hypothetical protein